MLRGKRILRSYGALTMFSDCRSMNIWSLRDPQKVSSAIHHYPTTSYQIDRYYRTRVSLGCARPIIRETHWPERLVVTL